MGHRGSVQYSKRHFTLTIFAASNTPITYLGWAEVNILTRELTTVTELNVPMLVSGDLAVPEDPIIGYNVVEVVINRDAGRTALGRKELAQNVSKAFSITVKSAQMVIKQHSDTDQDTSVIRTGWKEVFLPAKCATTVQVRARISSQFWGQDMLFPSVVLHPPQ